MRYLALALLLSTCAAGATAQVQVTGTVPDEATRAAVLARLREVYGSDAVADRIAVGAAAAPASWSGAVQKLITPDLKQVTRGQLRVAGTVVSLEGEVANEDLRRKIGSTFAAGLGPDYTFDNRLRVSALASDQEALERFLAKHTIEFENGKAELTPAGRAILDLLAAMPSLKNRRVELTGHTDNTGLRATNLALSQARAEAVKAYLAGHGVNGDMISASGQGQDRPLAGNDSADGRARNRRIEFKLLQ